MVVAAAAPALALALIVVKSLIVSCFVEMALATALPDIPLLELALYVSDIVGIAVELESAPTSE